VGGWGGFEDREQKMRVRIEGGGVNDSEQDVLTTHGTYQLQRKTHSPSTHTERA
jgi:hypothetical protein